MGRDVAYVVWIRSLTLAVGSGQPGPYQLGVGSCAVRRNKRISIHHSNLEYSERLKKLNVTTLICRRARGDMLETFKYLKGQYNSAPILHLDTRTHETTTRGHQLKLEKCRSRQDVRKHFFTQRVVNLWKALPVNLVSAPTVNGLNAFKNRLDKLERCPVHY